jgi:hypothetical protein
MPVIRSGGDNRIDTLVIQQPANIRAGNDVFVALLEFPYFTAENLLVRITQGHYAHTFKATKDSYMLSALASEANYGHANIVVGAKCT